MKILFSFLIVFSKIIVFGQTTYIPDDNFEQKLINLGYDSGPLDDYVLTANINLVEMLYINSGDDINDFTGIEDFASLKDFFSFNNDFAILDLSNNSNLEFVEIQANDSLEFLNLQNGNNNSIVNLGLYNLPYLECVLVDNPSYFNTTFPSYLNSGITFNTVCNDVYTDISDSNFEYSLINLGYDILFNGRVKTASIDTITKLDISNRGISDLTGIEDFTSLTELRCEGNKLINLDLSANTNLSLLLCNDNLLENLNVKNGNNENMFFCVMINNSELYCVEVDNVNYSQDTWLLRDNQTSFSEQCVVGLTPNLLMNDLIFQINESVVSIESNYEISYVIYDMSGAKIEESIDSNKISLSINLNKFNSGVYFVNVMTRYGSISKKIIVL